MFQRKSLIDQEWDKNQKKEQKFFQHRGQEDSFLNKMLSEKIPDKMQDALVKAFAKAFEVVFEKGTAVIEKTYKKDELQKNYEINEYAHELRKSRKSLNAFEKKAGGAVKKNLLISSAAGIGMGVLGIGIPDIPVFTAMVLKNIYEIALNYGFEYESEKERYFILMIIEGAVCYGKETAVVNHKIDQYIYEGILPKRCTEKEQISRTVTALSKELLYMKFLQGIPVVGAVGGFYDAVYMKRISEYANIKYKKRFLLTKKR